MTMTCYCLDNIVKSSSDASNTRLDTGGFFIALVMFLFSTSAYSQDVGINFSSMKVGTRLTTATVWEPGRTYADEFIGKEDGFFIMQTYQLLDDGSPRKRNKVGYDQSGRKVFSSLDGKTNTYSPYSCHYVVGSCSHTYKYFNRITGKFVTNEGTFDNRIEGDHFILGVVKTDGSKFEVRFELGPHNLRLSNVHQNALGQPTGYRFIDLFIPE